MEEVVKAYLAGIVDGEGTVTLMKHHKNETPSPAVTVSNNSLKLLKWIQARVGGGITSKKKRDHIITTHMRGVFGKIELFVSWKR